ncbi:MAG: GspE/PulE family protein [Aliidiomarina sp.]|uniref:GspE/PulE family protein n=1 Tax=Aliidiomarina sp. TaxID=1872439 RepID=UPI0025C32DDB|nr:GspE/PulE family protein [Aliidiomarina sp.]MCH8502468.1 GspE/PulE family protein [Aliidiomarina sp.]
MVDVETLLTQELHVSPEEVQKASLYQQRHGGRLEQILVRMGALSSELLPQYYTQVFSVPLISADELAVVTERDDFVQVLQEAVPEHLRQSWQRVGLYPINPHQLRASADANLILACLNPTDIAAMDVLASYDERTVELRICTEEQMALVEQASKSEVNHDSGVDLSLLEEDRLRELASEAPTVNLLNNLIAKGLRRRASDMHLEPWKGKGRVRYRVDGVLHDADLIPARMLLPVVTRLKLLANMDIAEKRRPQDGKIDIRVDGRNVDIRVSAMPVGEGESVVMRFLLQDSLSYDVGALGIEPDIEAKLMDDIQSTSGVVLMTGPTGSGKTTSLYSFLTRRNEPGVKIITIEDPVEYQLDGINQVQVQADIGYTFAKALRTVVRQDPDIIMVGEIRDQETASIALQSALTGHLVFSTLHTNDAASAYTRLLDLGVEEFLLSAAVKVVLAQRLARKLCPHCKVPDTDAAKTAAKLNLQWLCDTFHVSPSYHKAVGCEHCGHTGYLGRVAIIEYLKCDDELTALLGKPDFLQAAAKLNRQRGSRSLLEDGMLKAMRGETSVAEVMRVAG